MRFWIQQVFWVTRSEHGATLPSSGIRSGIWAALLGYQKPSCRSLHCFYLRILFINILQLIYSLMVHEIKYVCLFFHYVPQNLCPVLKFPITLIIVPHQAQNVCWSVQWRMWLRAISPGTKKHVYCPASVCLSATIYVWIWIIRIMATTAVWSPIHSSVRLNI